MCDSFPDVKLAVTVAAAGAKARRVSVWTVGDFTDDALSSDDAPSGVAASRQ